MPPSLGRRAQQHHLSPPQGHFSDSGDEVSDEEDMGAEENREAMGDEMVTVEGEEEDLEDEEALGRFVVSYLRRRISSLPSSPSIPLLAFTQHFFTRFQAPGSQNMHLSYPCTLTHKSTFSERNHHLSRNID